MKDNKVTEMPALPGTTLPVAEGQTPQAIGQNPALLPHCPTCLSDIGKFGLKHIGLPIPVGGNRNVETVIIYCGNKECLAVIGVLQQPPQIDMLPRGPMAAPSIVGATHVPPVPGFMDPTKKKG